MARPAHQGHVDPSENEVAPPKRGHFHCPAEADDQVVDLLPRHKGIYHAGCTGYPNPTYP
jgi:hypothetical protein